LPAMRAVAGRRESPRPQTRSGRDSESLAPCWAPAWARRWAARQSARTRPSAALLARQRYNTAYSQCMYSYCNQVLGPARYYFPSLLQPVEHDRRLQARPKGAARGCGRRTPGQ
jgi:hypothetical protein